MDISQQDLMSVLAELNPWWRGAMIPDLPTWHRAAFHELFNWVYSPPAPRAILLSGARQVGKTTLILQIIENLLNKGVPAANILYTTFDHPLMKLAGVERVLKVWREREPKAEGPEYVFLDEAQFIPDFGVWVKHQADFNKNRRIIFTGSCMPLYKSNQESGVGRWHTIRITTLSFYEYLKLKHAQVSTLPELPKLNTLDELFTWSPQDFYRITELASPYVGYFHEYLVRGGFPQTTLVTSLHQAQRLLREDIIDKVLKRDMTAFFGVRRVLELEQLFLYLCMHDGGQLDMSALCNNLAVKRPTIHHFIELLEATHLIYKLQLFGYGKEVLRGHYKIYLADAAMSAAVLLKGNSILDDPVALGNATETAVFKHLYARYYRESPRFSYWHNQKKQEVDIIVETGAEMIPFEVKYRHQHTGINELQGLLDFCEQKTIPIGYVVTKELDDFGLFASGAATAHKIMRIPAPLLCYWLGQAELLA
jgi:predicted AAA+ superfamily ATPase